MSGLVRPLFCTDDHKVSLYFTMWRPFPLKVAPSHGGIGTPIKCMVPWAHLSPQPKRHLDRCSRFCRAHRQTDRPTDRPTDHATQLVTIGCIYSTYVVLWCGLTTTIVLWPLNRSACISWHPWLRTGGYRCSKVLTPSCPQTIVVWCLFHCRPRQAWIIYQPMQETWLLQLQPAVIQSTY